MVEKNSADAVKGKRKQLVSVQEIRRAVGQIDTVRARLDTVLAELENERITALAFDGVGWAARAESALASYSSAIRGAITDPKSERVHSQPEAIAPVTKPKRK